MPKGVIFIPCLLTKTKVFAIITDVLIKLTIVGNSLEEGLYA